MYHGLAFVILSRILPKSGQRGERSGWVPMVCRRMGEATIRTLAPDAVEGKERVRKTLGKHRSNEMNECVLTG